MDQWIEEYPDLLELMQKYRGIQVYPCQDRAQVTLLEDNKTPATVEIDIKPATLELLKGVSSVVHRQVTVDGRALDLRTMVGRMLFTTPVPNLADACRIWLADLKNERKASVRRKVRILLSRAVGIRGEELAAYDPRLKQRVMQALCGRPGAEEGGY